MSHFPVTVIVPAVEAGDIEGQVARGGFADVKGLVEHHIARGGPANLNELINASDIEGYVTRVMEPYTGEPAPPDDYQGGWFYSPIRCDWWRIVSNEPYPAMGLAWSQPVENWVDKEGEWHALPDWSIWWMDVTPERAAAWNAYRDELMAYVKVCDTYDMAVRLDCHI